MNNSLPVLISGAGLGGLVLANVLQRQGVPFRIFERATLHDKHSQGWSLNLHFCLDKLSSLIDPKKAATMGPSISINPVHPSDTELAIIDGSIGKILFKQPRKEDDNTTALIRANRLRLRNWLAEGIPIEYNMSVEKFDVERDDSIVTVTLHDGSTAKGSVLVGADGVYSAVCREHMGTNAFLEATSINPVHALSGSTIIDKEKRAVFESLSSAAFMTYGLVYKEYPPRLFTSLLDIIEGGSHYVMQWFLSWGGANAAVIMSGETDKERLDQARNLLLMSHCKRGPTANLVYEAPDDTRVMAVEVHERGPPAFLEEYPTTPVTLLGDAAHAMTPFGGEAANHAILDACLLGEQLTSVYRGEKPLFDAINTYQKEMVHRGRTAVQKSHECAVELHASRDGVIEKVKEVGYPEILSPTRLC